MHRILRIGGRGAVAVAVLAATAATTLSITSSTASAGGCLTAKSQTRCGTVINHTGRSINYARYPGEGDDTSRWPVGTCDTWNWGTEEESVAKLAAGRNQDGHDKVTNKVCQQAAMGAGAVGGQSGDVDAFSVNSEDYYEHVGTGVDLLDIAPWRKHKKGVWTKIPTIATVECVVHRKDDHIYCTIKLQVLATGGSQPVWGPDGPAPTPTPTPTHQPGTAYVPAPLVVDGSFGPLTKAALQHALNARYQADLPESGVFGPRTKKALQHALGVTEDGVIGPETVRALQVRVGAKVDGVWGPDTTRHLQEALNHGQF
jgi:peptidoglycan hydrolase-like protein with peptidoglycan-binding domain